MTDYVAVVRLIALNAHDFIRVSRKYLASMGQAEVVDGFDENVNHLQVKMLGWAYLLNLWTGILLKQYDGNMTENAEFREAVERAWKSYIEEDKLNE